MDINGNYNSCDYGGSRANEFVKNIIVTANYKEFESQYTQTSQDFRQNWTNSLFFID